MNKLVSPDGWVDDTMQIGRTGMFNIIKHNWAKWNLKEYGNIPNDFKRRGVDDTEALPNYHYRDDATLMWNAIHKYVGTVVSAFYGRCYGPVAVTNSFCSINKGVCKLFYVLRFDNQCRVVALT